MTFQKSKTKKEMCLELGCSYPTLRKWIIPIEKEVGAYVAAYTPKQVTIIYNHLVFV